MDVFTSYHVCKPEFVVKFVNLTKINKNTIDYRGIYIG